MRKGVPKLMDKIARYRPRIVCFLSKAVWEVFLRESFRLTNGAYYTTPIVTAPMGSPSTTRSPPGPSKSLRSQFFETSKDDDNDGLDGQAPGSSQPIPNHAPRVRYKFQWGAQPFTAKHHHAGKLPHPSMPDLLNLCSMYQLRTAPLLKKPCSLSFRAHQLELSDTRQVCLTMNSSSMYDTYTRIPSGDTKRNSSSSYGNFVKI